MNIIDIFVIKTRFYITTLYLKLASLVARTAKQLPAILQDTQVWSLGQKDPQEKWMTTHSSILTWRISWKEEPGRLQSMRPQRIGHDWRHWARMHILLDKSRRKWNVGPVAFEEVNPDLEFSKRPTSSSHLISLSYEMQFCLDG